MSLRENDILNTLDYLNLTKHQLKDVLLVLPTKFSALELFNNFCKCDFFKGAFLPKIVGIKNSSGGITKIEKIAILTKILKKKFGALNYSGVLEYAKDLSTFISDYYSYSLNLDILHENSNYYNNLSEIADMIKLYEISTDILKKQDPVIVAMNNLKHLLESAKYVMLLGCENMPQGYRNIVTQYKDKIIPLKTQNFSTNIQEKISYKEFNSNIEKAKYIAFKVSKIIDSNSDVTIISNDVNLNNLIAILLKRYHITPCIKNDNFLKTNLYEFVIEAAELIKASKITDLIALLKNELSVASNDTILKFENVIRKSTFIGENFIPITKVFLQKEDDDNFCNLLRAISAKVQDKNATKITFFEHTKYLRNFIDLVISNDYKSQIDLYFDFLISGTKDILSDKIDFSEYINLLKKFSAFYSVTSEKQNFNKVKIMNFASAKLLSSDYVIFASVDDQIFPNTIYKNYWINKGLREKLGIKDDLEYEDLYNIINATRIKCFIFHSKESDRAHIIDELFAKYPSIEECDISEYDSYNEQFKKFIKLKYAKNTIKPKLPSPNPPIEKRPTTFSATDINFLIKNPYKIYVKYILKLNELNFFDIGLENARKGNIIHEIMQDLFDRQNIDVDSLQDSKLWIYNIDNLYKYFNTETHNFSNDYKNSLTEVASKLYIDKFTIKVRADRLDIFEDNSFGLIDYKTGTLPSKSSVLAMTNPQMLVEALVFISDKNKFKNLSQIKYIKFIKLSKTIEELMISNDIDTIAKLLSDAEQKLLEILNDSMIKPYRAYLEKYPNMESDPVFKLSRAHEIFY